jgi:hypothetical protein
MAQEQLGVGVGNMDLRDFFAAHAVSGLMASATSYSYEEFLAEREKLVLLGFLIADEMMEARSKT